MKSLFYVALNNVVDFSIVSVLKSKQMQRRWIDLGHRFTVAIFLMIFVNCFLIFDYYCLYEMIMGFDCLSESH